MPILGGALHRKVVDCATSCLGLIEDVTICSTCLGPSHAMKSPVRRRVMSTTCAVGQPFWQPVQRAAYRRNTPMWRKAEVVC